MRLFVYSGMNVRPIIERCDSAVEALSTVQMLRAQRLRNIRIADAKGGELSLTTLRLLAAEESECDNPLARRTYWLH
jgi:hypothetical protein